MLDELAEIIIGPWGLAGLIILGTPDGRQLSRKLFKATIKAGLCLAERGNTVISSLERLGNEIVEEAKKEASE